MAAATTIADVIAESDTIEGIIDDFWYHYHVSYDLLHFALNSRRREPSYGEETPTGFTLFRADDDIPVGLTIFDFWKRFGTGERDRMSPEAVRCVIEEQVIELARTEVLAAPPSETLALV